MADPALPEVDPSSAPRRERSLGRERALTVACLVGLIALVAANAVAFLAWTDTDYLRWYLANGTLFSLVFGLVALAWGDLEKETGLIAAHPRAYLSSSFGLLSNAFLSVSAMLSGARDPMPTILPEKRAEFVRDVERRRDSGEISAEDAEQAISVVNMIPDRPDPASASTSEPVPGGLGPLDYLVGVVFSMAFLVAVAGWLLVVVPAQYFAYLVTAAPARLALTAPDRTTRRTTAGTVLIEEAPKRRGLPAGAIESGFSEKPVALTSAVTALVLYVVSAVVG